MTPASALVRAAVGSVKRLSPHFIRIGFEGPGMSAIGRDGAVYDQRIKLILPGADGHLPKLTDTDDWYRRWQDLPADHRGSVRTYSVRSLTEGPEGTRLTVDFVLHPAPGPTGPASSWAAGARPGDEIMIVGPRRGAAGGGVEFTPGGAGRVLLAGDETAAPAISRILEDLTLTDPDISGAAFIEVPTREDVLGIRSPAGVDTRWLSREGAPHGTLLTPAVLAHLTGQPRPTAGGDSGAGGAALLWETPTFSGSGERVDPGPARGDGDYYWIAGESGVVTRLRRHLVGQLGIPRSQVAFMGYWKLGTAMGA